MDVKKDNVLHYMYYVIVLLCSKGLMKYFFLIGGKVLKIWKGQK